MRKRIPNKKAANYFDIIQKCYVLGRANLVMILGNSEFSTVIVRNEKFRAKHCRCKACSALFSEAQHDISKDVLSTHR